MDQRDISKKTARRLQHTAASAAAEAIAPLSHSAPPKADLLTETSRQATKLDLVQIARALGAAADDRMPTEDLREAILTKVPGAQLAFGRRQVGKRDLLGIARMLGLSVSDGIGMDALRSRLQHRLRETSPAQAALATSAELKAELAEHPEIDGRNVRRDIREAEAREALAVVAPKPLPAPHGKAQLLVEERRARIVAELDRIRGEILAYATSGRVDYGHAGSLGEVLNGLDHLHMVGAAYKREAAQG